MQIQTYQLSSSSCTHTYSRTLICNESVLYSTAIVNLDPRDDQVRVFSPRPLKLCSFLQELPLRTCYNKQRDYLSYSMVFYRELQYCLDQIVDKT